MNPEYTRRLDKIEALLRSRLPDRADAAWVDFAFAELGAAPPLELIKTLTDPGRDLLLRGGKRWRPLLMTLVCETLGGGDGAIPLSPLVEFPHTGSLIHDDIEDNSDERRGKPAAHILYGVDTAINSGCFLYFLPLACLNDWDAPAERKNRIHQVYGEHLRRIHLGQAMDIAWHRNFSSLPSLEEYYLMCRLKTGVLARLSAELGVYAAGRTVRFGTGDDGQDNAQDSAQRDGQSWEVEMRLALELGKAAENLGVGFQILDDVKNLTTGNPGKKRGDDIVEGKKSLPILLYLHQKGNRREFVIRCFSAARAGGTGSREVEELIRELDEAGCIEEARKKGTELIAGANGALSGGAFRGLRTEPSALRLLTGFISLLG